MNLRILATLGLLTFLVDAASALMIGKRRIQCTTIANGDALLDQRPTIPAIVGYVGFQALLPSIGQCPFDVQVQPPWYLGPPIGGGGLCPLEYWNLAPFGAFVAIVGSAIAFNVYTTANRLLVDSDSVGLVNVNGSGSNLSVDRSGDDNMISFSDIEDWNMLPFGLVINRKSTGGPAFFPVSWDPPSVKALMEDRVGNGDSQ